jgi:hypothetical protein
VILPEVWLGSVCGIWTQELIPETLKVPDEVDVVLDIENITIHPNFVNGQARGEYHDMTHAYKLYSRC